IEPGVDDEFGLAVGVGQVAVDRDVPQQARCPAEPVVHSDFDTLQLGGPAVLRAGDRQLRLELFAYQRLDAADRGQKLQAPRAQQPLDEFDIDAAAVRHRTHEDAVLDLLVEQANRQHGPARRIELDRRIEVERARVLEVGVTGRDAERDVADLFGRQAPCGNRLLDRVYTGQNHAAVGVFRAQRDVDRAGAPQLVVARAGDRIARAEAQLELIVDIVAGGKARQDFGVTRLGLDHFLRRTGRRELQGPAFLAFRPFERYLPLQGQRG